MGAPKPPKCRLAPSPWNILVKNQEVNCAKFSNFDRFCSQNLQTMSVNCFSVWGDFVLRAPTRASPLNRSGGLDHLGYNPQMKIHGDATINYTNFVWRTCTRYTTIAAALHVHVLTGHQWIQLLCTNTGTRSSPSEASTYHPHQPPEFSTVHLNTTWLRIYSTVAYWRTFQRCQQLRFLIIGLQ